jgi:Tol biopolymer transport system component
MAQTFVYSGREYFKVGRSWAQIREMNLATGQRIQLTDTPRDHWRPWCSPDGRSIFFTSSPLGGDKTLARFDRTKKTETPLLKLEQDLSRVVDAVDGSNLVVQEYGGVIEFVDVAKRQKVRRLSGVNPVLSPDRTLLARQTIADALARPHPQSHVLLSKIDGESEIDLGAGAGPVFLPGGTDLLFARLDRESRKLEIVRFNLQSKTQTVQATTNSEYASEVYDLGVSPDGSTILLATDGGRYGSAVYWQVTYSGVLKSIDDNLGSWGGWSGNGLLIYSTDGRDLRALDAKRGVWGSDIRLLDQLATKIRTVVSGTSMNLEPRWCSAVP